MNRVAKTKWASKLIGSKFFVLLTDKESVISLDGVDPNSLHDAIALDAQGASLREFHSRIGMLVKDHDKAAEKLYAPKKRSKRVKTGNKSVASGEQVNTKRK